MTVPGVAALERKTFGRWRHPLEFATDLIRPLPRDFQPRFFEAVRDHRRILLRCIRGGGKTWALGILIFWSLALGYRVVVVCPVHGQTDHLRRELESIWRASPRLRALFPGWRLFGDWIETPDPKVVVTFHSGETGAPLLEGAHAENVVLIIDEAKSIGDSIVKSLEPMLIGPESRIIAASTAGRGLNWFDQGFTTKRDAWDQCLTVGVDEVPHLLAKQAQMAKLLGEHDPLYRSFYLNEPGGGIEGTPFFELTKLERAVGAPLAANAGEARAWSVDPARFGRDATVVARRTGGLVHPLTSWSKADLMTTVGRIVEMLRSPTIEKPGWIVVDAAGVGSGVADRLRERLEEMTRWTPDQDSIAVVDFLGGARAPTDSEYFFNNKTWCGNRLAGAFERGEVSLPHDPALLAQLMSYTRSVTSSGKGKITDPTNRSPDRSDALMMLWCDDIDDADLTGGPRSLHRIHGL